MSEGMGFLTGSKGALEIVAKLPHSLAVDAVAVALAALALLEQPRLAQTVQMLRDRGLGKWKGLDNPAARGLTPFLKQLYDRNTRRVGQCASKVSQSTVLFVKSR